VPALHANVRKRLKNINDICMHHPEKCMVAAYSINLGQQLQLQNTTILAKKMRQMNQILREAI
jgi:hypothetical protein